MSAHGGEPTGRRLLAPLVILLFLILLGYTLRVHNLDAFSFWTDEGLTPERSGYSIAQILRNDILIQGVVTKDTHPPLYYLIIHLTGRLFGPTDFAFRYPSVLFGVLLIPLLYQVGRRMGGLSVGLVVALLAAVNPLQVYYSQEARMYTLLVLLTTSMSYVLWRALSRPGLSPPSLLRYLLLYGLLAGLAFYTHYTVAFLVAAQALFWVWLLWRGGLRWVILGAAAVGALVTVPLIPYTLPRLLAGAEANYYSVSPLTMLLDVVRFFHLGLTADFKTPLALGLNVLAVGLLLLGLWAAGNSLSPALSLWERGRAPFGRGDRWLPRLFLLAWLLAVVLGLMAGSILFKPMYQGVRHIMAGSPAYILLLGLGIGVIWNWLPRRRRKKRRRPDAQLTGWAAWVAGAPRYNPIALVPLILLLLGAAVALVNLYTNPRYAKDDFRAIVRFIETRAGDRDVIVYNNAVLLPLHEHYRRRPDVAVTALPVYPQSATGQEPELAALARGYDRVWFVTDPPADGRDDSGLIRVWLDANLTEAINQLFPARTTEARVIGYATTGGAPQAIEPGEWEGSPALTGAAFDSQLALPTLWVDLIWEGERPANDAQLIWTLTGPDGKEQFRRAHFLLRDDAYLWRDDASNRLSYDLPLPPGLPPGAYTLAVALEGGEPQLLGTVEIASTDAWPAAPDVLFGDTVPAGNDRPAIVWPNALSLAAVELGDDTVLPGNNLPLTLYWRVGPDGLDLTDLRYRLEVIGASGEVLRSQESQPGASWLGRVAPGALLRETTGLYFRPETPPGNYRLRWTLLDGDTPIAAPVEYGRLTVEPWPLVTELPAAQTILQAEFGPAIRLFGYDLGEMAGGALPMTLYWQATAQPEGDYSVFIHLVDEAGNIVSQSDAVPAGGARPTTGWRTGEVITDAHTLSIPADLPPGLYRPIVGLYNPNDGARLPVTLAGEPQPDGQLLLPQTVRLPEGAP